MTMITVKYTGSETPETDNELWQYDFGQVLLLTGLPDLGGTVDVHVSTQRTGGIARELHGTVTPDGIAVTLLDDLLENEGTTRNYSLYVWVYHKDNSSGHTAAFFVLPVFSRPRPDEPNVAD